MVLKEEVLLWFKDLDGYKRIDVMYEILNMCLPFELRFIGSCIEELGKHSYQELRGSAIIANDLEKISKKFSSSHGILDESVRHRLLIYLSLLSSRNHSVASWLYKKLLRTECIEEYLVKDKAKDETLHSEFLLLFTMALHHPAFNFEHKQYFSRILLSLIHIRDNRISAIHNSLGYPPGFGYPTQMPPEISSVPVKAAPTLCGDSPSVCHNPPGLQHLPSPRLDFISPIWNRRGFPYGAPEVPPFPAPAISPLVSQAASPSQSRSTSPHRTVLGRSMSSAPSLLPPHPTVPLPPVPPPQPAPPPICGHQQPLIVEVPSGAGQPKMALEQLPRVPVFNSTPPEMKLIEDDVAKLVLAEENRLRDILSPQHQQLPIVPDVKPNGVRICPPFVGKVRPYIVEQMQAMNVETENSLHLSNSSSNSSPTETPPGTPSVTPTGPGRGEGTPAVTPVGADRGDGKPRTNGAPPFVLPMPDSSVPYSFPYPFTTMPPSRSMFHYTQSYRPAFAGPFPNFVNDTYPTYTIPYVHLMYSSPFQHRTPPGCCNCGASNHVDGDCREQSIDEITEKNSYQLEFTTLPDSDK